MKISHSGSIYNAYLSGESCSEGNYPATMFVQSNPMDLHSGRPYMFTPVGVVCLEAGARGQLGIMPDLWWAPQSMNQGSTFPSDGSRQFIKIGDLIYPWDGSNPLIG